MGLFYRLLYYMVLFFPTGHKTQSDDGSEKAIGSEGFLEMEDDIVIYFSIREKVIKRDCVRYKKGVGNLTAIGDQSANK